MSHRDLDPIYHTPEKRPATYMAAVGRWAVANVTRSRVPRQQPWDIVSLHPYVDPPALDGEFAELQASLTALGGPARL